MIQNRKSQIARTLVFLSICSTSLLLAGCATTGCTATAKVGANKDGVHGEVSTACTWGNATTMNFFDRAVANLYAFTGMSVYDLDFSSMAMDMSVTNGYAPNQTGNALVRLFNNTTLIAEKNFSFVMQSGQAKFSDPQAVKQWAANFEGISNKATYSIQPKLETGTGQVGFTQTSRYGATAFATASATTVIADDCVNCQVQ